MGSTGGDRSRDPGCNEHFGIEIILQLGGWQNEGDAGLTLLWGPFETVGFWELIPRKAAVTRPTAKIENARKSMITRTRAAWDRYQELSALDEADRIPLTLSLSKGPDHPENLCDTDADSPDPEAPDYDDADDADDAASARPPGWRRLAIEPPKPDEPPASNAT